MRMEEDPYYEMNFLEAVFSFVFGAQRSPFSPPRDSSALSAAALSAAGGCAPAR